MAVNVAITAALRQMISFAIKRAVTFAVKTAVKTGARQRGSFKTPAHYEKLYQRALAHRIGLLEVNMSNAMGKYEGIGAGCQHVMREFMQMTFGWGDRPEVAVELAILVVARTVKLVQQVREKTCNSSTWRTVLCAADSLSPTAGYAWISPAELSGEWDKARMAMRSFQVGARQKLQRSVKVLAIVQ